MFCRTKRQRESRWFYRHVLAEYIQQIPKSSCGASLWHRISSFVLQHTYKIWWVAMYCLKLQRWHFCWHSQSGSLYKIPQSVVGHIRLSISTQFVLQWACKECFAIFLPSDQTDVFPEEPFLSWWQNSVFPLGFVRNACKSSHIICYREDQPASLSHVQASIVRTCNCIYSMIQQRQRDIEYRETANDTRQR
jgi:hypothetical protein